MAILDVIEFFDDSGEILVAKIPEDGSGDFCLGSQLVVQESQIAVFFRDGRALDGFKAGRHTLTTQNLPFLRQLIGAPFGGRSPFRSYVYFIATKTFVNLGWGTPTPVAFRDADFRVINVRAHGMFSIRVAKARTFLNTLVGTRGMQTTFAMEEFFRSVIVSRLHEVLGATMKSILDLPTQYGIIAQGVRNAVKADFEQYGIELVDLLIEAITPPPEVQEMINRASGIAVQDVTKYQAVAAADAMRDAARNPSGGAGEGLGAGLGLAMGIGMAQQVAASLARPGTPAPTGSSGVQPPGPSTPGASGAAAGDLRTKLKELMDLKNDGLITEADFEDQKRRLLNQV